MSPAEQEVLRLCRKHNRGYVSWCMRERNGRCRVVDNARFDSPIIAEGGSWEEVLPVIRNLVKE